MRAQSTYYVVVLIVAKRSIILRVLRYSASRPAGPARRARLIMISPAAAAPQQTSVVRRRVVLPVVALAVTAVYAITGFIAVVRNSSNITTPKRGRAHNPSTATTTTEAVASTHHRRAVPSGTRAPAVIFVALRDGPAGAVALREWSDRVVATTTVGNNDVVVVMPPVWILCSPNSTIESAVRETPHLLPFPVNASSSTWAEVFEQFLSQNLHASVVGLFGEGSLPPHSDLSKSIESVKPVLTGSALLTPTAIVARSRRRRGKRRGAVVAEEADEWLSDKFVAQVWCNRAMLAGPRIKADLDSPLQGGGLRQLVQDATLSAVLPILLHRHQVDRAAAARANSRTTTTTGGSENNNNNVVVVDGTQVLPSFVDDVTGVTESLAVNSKKSSRSRERVSPGKGTPPNKHHHQIPNKRINNDPLLPPADLYIGTLNRALVHKARNLSSAEGGMESRFVGTIVEAPWPPEYVLETVANDDGLVVVTNVNCGYLDFATNFLMSVRRVSDVKVRCT